MTFHEGELLVQDRAGVRGEARRVGQMLRPAIRPDARTFLAERRFAIVAAEGDGGRVWASILVGPPGFLASSDDGTWLDVSVLPEPGDPIAPAFSLGNSIGLVAIDFAARRRYRVNGIIQSVGPGFSLDVREAFGNCPKYIHAYSSQADGTLAPGNATASDELDDRQRQWIETSETFFLGTMHPDAGADASHRGGAAGFVRVSGPRKLLWGDYLGNRLFQSLGNTAVHPPAGLLFLDPETGSTLQLTGTLEIDWSPEAAATIPGAERVLRFSIEQVVERPGAIPLRWVRGQSSPANPPAR
ncbi:MAG TPA: pyridoxamine 5'-phosphate oxidase family protein [Myxococcaceae bacterium]|nr:pyridoxamine 5'-phosphate oxidase family protein [Myxococcaceae bacterium]